MSRYGYRDITDVCLIDLATNKPVIFMDYLLTSSQAIGNELVYLKAGRGAGKIASFQSQNEVKLEITAGLLTPEMLGIMFGTDVTTGVQNVPVTTVFTCTTNTFDLAATPIVGTDTPITVAYSADGTVPDIHLTKVDGTPAATEFKVDGFTVTVNSSTYASGGKFLVTYYIASSASNKRVKFQADKFTKAYKLTGFTLWKNIQDEQLYASRVTIPKLQIEINGATLNSAMEGEPTSLKFTGQCLKTSSSTDLIIYDIDEGTPVTSY